ncbi:hypothetical protein LZ554_000458 [Drepanopeziza brunnea f. sp. 'monogermtubi']|nr:hypothetical protein LZ554_000458 [Drepanopeziza brunnea f. sp. 'monogermtubi']
MRIIPETQCTVSKSPIKQQLHLNPPTKPFVLETLTTLRSKSSRLYIGDAKVECLGPNQLQPKRNTTGSRPSITAINPVS